jgi:hypothetical protein
VTRVLPAAEWPRLVGTELETVIPTLSPAFATVLVVEQGDRIVACWALVSILHCEGLWVHPDCRHSVGVNGRIWAGMRKLVTDAGASAVLTAAITPEIETLILKRGGTALPGTHFRLPMEETRCRPL